ncbi:MAG TPA: flavodoxin-dependent (E)-4-hydroxy-3-methylbut-2-enyl-diphosphate synthase, partial [Chloroflexota bacterium]|nr:flavodoxin-dependent (E)-4-hydroxy-3-methylbut-2-enyl-diphosphate synthase [Chloroflexota bacterium]
DIHFSPAAALVAADFADKVRVNPGNYADSRKFAVREYSDSEYEAELARVEERFAPLVLKCKERGISIRIGTNHGSLSDRIMNRFGDTPEGMVESALEFVRICEKHEYHDIILSMKASNPKVMIAAYRLLAARMAELGMDYPFHLGVTEAGNAEDGRIKSAIGIGSLLEDGIGDTIRVSLTEEPEAEIPVAQAIAARYERRPSQDCPLSGDVPWDPFHYERRPSTPVSIADLSIGGTDTVAVLTPIDDLRDPATRARLLRWASPAGRRQPKPDGAVLRLAGAEDVQLVQNWRQALQRLPQARLPLIARSEDVSLLQAALPSVDAILCGPQPARELLQPLHDSGKPLVAEASIGEMAEAPSTIDDLLGVARDAFDLGVRTVLSLRAGDGDWIHAYRLLATRAADAGIEAPILLHASAGAEPLLPTSITIGSLLCDGLGDVVMISGTADGTELSFNILQGAGTRLTRTDYVACPSCGRTLFDLQETTDRIKQRTSHLVGVKLAIMGCIVNGPGEMADADFGYVGGAPGMVNLYVGKECVEKGVPAEIADDRLIDLIRSRGKWQEAGE